MNAGTEPAAVRYDAKSAGRSSLVCGLMWVMIGSVVATLFIWSSTIVPDTCDSSISTYFFLQGIACAAIAILSALSTCALKERFSAMSHQALAAKYHEQHRDEEAGLEKEQFERQAGIAKFIMTSLMCLTMPVYEASFGIGIFGIVQVCRSTSSLCGNAVTVFWLLFVLTWCSHCASCAAKICGHHTKPTEVAGTQSD
eukprot:TRINITY_DN7427_c0_g2_i1.p1 TRINITY_DN7427_c0_g2~~TRINITY_DN7427_c0_g2_i1.p1  ORF type:complete len:225 (+),score=17.73 TRINITY_DN7427_c0_g2_i1:84-677(+)